MREIKFRAWDKERHKMLDWNDLIFQEAITKTTVKELLKLKIDFRWVFWEKLQNMFELIQYIGLKDKNEKEIYEGDIVKCYIMGNSADYLQLEAEDKDYVIREISIPEVYQEGLPDNCEIIGNIYENLNLLTNK